MTQLVNESGPTTGARKRPGNGANDPRANTPDNDDGDRDNLNIISEDSQDDRGGNIRRSTRIQRNNRYKRTSVFTATLGVATATTMMIPTFVTEIN